MTKKIILFTLIILLIFSNSVISTDTFKTLDNYYYILALGIDKKTDTEITVTIQILETSGNSSENSNEKPILYSASGSTISSCLSTLETSLSKQINLSHCSAIIFSEEILKSNNISSIIATLGNNTEVRNTTYIFSCSNKASEFLQTISNTEENFSADIYEKFLDSSYDIGYTEICTFGKFFSSCKQENISILLPYIKQNYDTSSNKSTYQINGNLIIKNGIFVENLSSYETLLINLLTNSLKTGDISIQSPFDATEYIDLSIWPSKKTSFNTYIVNNSPFVEINIYPEFVIKSSGSNYNYLSDENVQILESTLNDYLRKSINDVCYKITHDLNTDLLSIKDKYKTTYLTYDEFEKLNFDKIYSTSFYKVNIKSYIVSSNLFNKQ